MFLCQAHGRIGGVCKDGFDAGCEELRKRILKIEPLIHVMVFFVLVDFLTFD